MVDRSFWAGRRVLVTGHTGFKGGWLTTWLSQMRATVAGYALEPFAGPSFFSACGMRTRLTSVTGDVRAVEALRQMVERHSPEIVFHLAAQALVRRSYAEPLETFSTNVMGTATLLDVVARTAGVRAVVVVTSDKCYENREWIWGYRESDALGGHDPYSASKACAELLTASYRSAILGSLADPIGVATVRAGNVIGGGDWGADRLIPDAVRALQAGRPLLVRCPDAKRPWQHVLEPLSGYLALAERLYHDPAAWSGPWNFGPRDDDVVAVADVIDSMFAIWGLGAWQRETEAASPHETTSLKLDCTKARAALGWRPLMGLRDAIALAVEWYRESLAGCSADHMYQLTCDQIAGYEARLRAAADS